MVFSFPAWAGEEAVESVCDERTVTVRGSSMSPLIKSGSRIDVVLGEASCFAPLQIGDVIIFENGSNDLPLLKRIYAMGGNEFKVKDGKIFVNGQRVTNSQDVFYSINEKRAAMLELYIRENKGIMPANTLLVLGDNVGGTDDSSRFGLVHTSDVIGKVIHK